MTDSNDFRDAGSDGFGAESDDFGDAESDDFGVGEFGFGSDLIGEFPAPDPRGAPTHWPSLSAEAALIEWDTLWTWVGDLQRRFPHLIRLPRCWWQHNDVVEVLAALRDYERYAFSGAAYACGAVDWHRALRDMESRLDAWIKRFACAVSDRGHPEAGEPGEPPQEWIVFVSEDLARRSYRAEQH
jgi:hypothetical protein